MVRAKRFLVPLVWVLVVVGVAAVIWMAVAALTTTGQGEVTHTAEGADLPCDVRLLEPGTYQLCNGLGVTVDPPVVTSGGSSGITATATNNTCYWHLALTQLGQTVADWWVVQQYWLTGFATIANDYPPRLRT